jgi:hypothetical protein
MVENIFENTAQTLNLFPVADKKVELTFSGDRISSDGGLLLLREVENQIGIIDSISKCIKDDRDQRYISHTIKELLTQRIFQIAAGYEDCKDCNDLRSDMVLKTSVGRLPQSGEELASQPTMSRLENSIAKKELYLIGKQLIDAFITSYSQAPKVIILDCDDTNNNTYGQQELNFYNHHYGEHCYMPLHIYEGLSGKLVTTILKPGRRDKQNNIAAFLKTLISHLRKHWPQTMIIVRGDSHFASKDFMQWCIGQDKTGFITGLAGNKKLNELAAITINSAQREFKQYNRPVKRYHSFMYKAGSWEAPQKVILKVEVSHLGTNIRYIVTNLVDYKAKQLYEKGYCARCAMELRIKEHKLYLKSDKSSCKSFWANQFRLYMHSVAYVLLHTMQKELFKGSDLENATFKTIQNKIIKTAAWVKEMKTKLKIEFPRFCPTRNIQTKSFQMLELLRT